MKLRFLLLVIVICATLSVANMKKVKGLDTRINNLTKGMVDLNTKMDRIIVVDTKLDRFSKGLTVLDKKTDKLITGMGTNINSLNSVLASLNTKWGKITGLHTKVNGLKNGMNVLNKKMNKLIRKIPVKFPEGRDCAEICRKGVYPSGVYKIIPDGKTKFDVYCDMKTSGGGWTIFQKRVDGSQNFYLKWNDYKTGFGNVKKEFWVGNDRLNVLTHMTGRNQRLRVDLWDKKGNTRYAEYGKFLVANESNKYKLTIGTYSGNAGDSFNHHNGAYFSTKDKDFTGGSKCATSYKGAWWYNRCHHSNLNGRYLNGKHSSFADGVNWYHWKGYKYSYPHAEMKIRPTNFRGCKK